MAHFVTCICCGKRFDRDKEPFIAVSARRYAHESCYKEKESQMKQEEKDREELELYIMTLFKEDYVNPRVQKQIKEYKNKYNYSYSGMRKALVYFYEVKKNDVSKANGGIGIVPYVYQDAYNYYYTIWLANQKNEIHGQKQYQPEVEVIKIKTPKVERKKRKLFSFLDREEKNE